METATDWRVEYPGWGVQRGLGSPRDSPQFSVSVPSPYVPASVAVHQECIKGVRIGAFCLGVARNHAPRKPLYTRLFSSHTETPGPLGGTSNPAGATKNSL